MTRETMLYSYVGNLTVMSSSQKKFFLKINIKMEGPQNE